MYAPVNIQNVILEYIRKFVGGSGEKEFTQIRDYWDFLDWKSFCNFNKSERKVLQNEFGFWDDVKTHIILTKSSTFARNLLRKFVAQKDWQTLEFLESLRSEFDGFPICKWPHKVNTRTRYRKILALESAVEYVLTHFEEVEQQTKLISGNLPNVVFDAANMAFVKNINRAYRQFNPDYDENDEFGVVRLNGKCVETENHFINYDSYHEMVLDGWRLD